MNLFEQIRAARNILELPENATMEEIKSNYRDLIRKWHPDRCTKDTEQCKEMTARIITAYRLINDYCKSYKFSFSKEEVQKYLSAEEWWMERFGKYHLWSHEPE